MSNLDSEQWNQKLKMYFNIGLSATEAIAWFCELRATVTGWKSEDGLGDPTKGEKAKRINQELCEVIRYVSELDTVPRKQDGGRKDYKGKPNVKDLRLWVWIYRKESQGSAGTGYRINQRYVNCIKDTIQQLINDGRLIDAAIVATGNPQAYCDSHELGCQRGPNTDERNTIAEFCSKIGFDTAAAYEEFYKGRTDKPLEEAIDELEEEFFV